MSLLTHFANMVSGDADKETKLVSAAQHGSREAYDTLIRVHERQLRGYLASRVGQNAADDVMQETWLAAWQALPKFSKRGRFRAWIYGIAFHKSIDFHRNKARMPIELPLEQTIPAADMHDWSGSAELREDVLKLIGELPDEQREVLDLYYYGELTLAEVALELQRNLNTVKSQFYRAHATVALHFKQAEKCGSGSVVLLDRERGGQR